MTARARGLGKKKRKRGNMEGERMLSLDTLNDSRVQTDRDADPEYADAGSIHLRKLSAGP